MDEAPTPDALLGDSDDAAVSNMDPVRGDGPREVPVDDGIVLDGLASQRGDSDVSPPRLTSTPAARATPGDSSTGEGGMAEEPAGDPNSSLRRLRGSNVFRALSLVAAMFTLVAVT
ncbi:hypothetical protein CC1G_15824 [Coprinopsis cinerea okayama7|uniref:Uncharacterized protein n=1 Tax=Coprinopsis cinerea (strain Okayama-7 / 130 / ATCC MYA-4618 / FGSC 9003) TaxID=240176 RepID=D6RR30_COPC7|nr:hypothetical protein CC1G_15824 [Coprinopsis cinerea okayama7\|eukprot:XP_002910029.1 hypothetical protein CC1G_15824 [Coprinopsis cinerea okayama7\